MDFEFFPLITQTMSVHFEVKGVLPWSYF